MPEGQRSDPAGALSALLAREDVESVDITGHDQVMVTGADGQRVRYDGVIGASERALVALVAGLGGAAGSARPVGEGELGG
jgi:hypothetical protein